MILWGGVLGCWTLRLWRSHVCQPPFPTNTPFTAEADREVWSIDLEGHPTPVNPVPRDAAPRPEEEEEGGGGAGDGMMAFDIRTVGQAEATRAVAGRM